MTDLLEKIVAAQKATPEEAFEVFDSLEPVNDIEFMIGQWKGTEIASGNPWDELLPNSGWYGKIFTSDEEVHPLVYYGGENEIYPVDPAAIPTSFKLPTGDYLKPFFQAARPAFQAQTTTARLRNIEYRKNTYTTMIYDSVPILDYFAKIDENRVFGIMDWKGVGTPYVFLLDREDNSGLTFDFAGK